MYSAPVGVGRPLWPPPTGPSFVDSIVATPKFQQYIYGPTVLILGTHSNVFTEFDGGDGTVAIHGYPSDPGSTKGVMSSHGCVRVGPDTINTLKAVPVGTPVDVIA
jgi:lipoprotein-anchoring transpeptidase ErfK/SrfK